LLLLLLGLMIDNRQMARMLHQLFCLVGLYLVSRVPPLAAGAFAEERREQTLGLLFLSGMGAAEVFASKVLSTALMAWTELLAIFPMLAVPFLIGGVSFDLFVATIFTLPNLLVFALAVTLLGSVLTEEEGAALVLAAVLGLGLCLLPVGIYFAQLQFASLLPSNWWLRLSPAYGLFLVWSGRAPQADIWANFGVTLVWSGLCLVGAGMVLKRFWREQEGGKEISAPWRERWRRLIRGGPEQCRSLAARWLDVNPFVWLAARDNRPASLAWGMIGGLCGVWLLGWVVWGSQWPSVPNLLLLALLLNFSLHYAIVYTAARVIADGRRDGAYELLLTTALEPSDIVWGTFEALTVYFLTAARCVLALNVALMLGGLTVRHWNGRALFVYFVAWAWVLRWAWGQSRRLRQPDRMPGWILTQNWQASSPNRRWRQALPAMWAALNCARPALAVWRASGGSGLWFSVCIWSGFSYVQRQTIATFPTGSKLQVSIATLYAVFLLMIVLLPPQIRKTFDAMEQRLILEFRDIAREPLPARNDPRFKKWDFLQRLGHKKTIYTPQERAMRLGCIIVLILFIVGFMLAFKFMLHFFVTIFEAVYRVLGG
jgi:hypothetical protein